MRGSVVPLVFAVIFLTPLPPVMLLAPISHAAAHGDGIGHGAVFNGTLAPGGQVTNHLDFEGGPLVGGWVFMLGARVQGGGLRAMLTMAGNVANQWTIPPGATWVRTSLLPLTGTYNLTLENPGPSEVTFRVYFDQSCNCVGKFVPAEIPDGMIIFNVDTKEPSAVFAQFNEPLAMHVRVTAALLANPRASWPDDFRTLTVSETPVRRQVRQYVVQLHELRFEAPPATRVYFFVEGLSFDAAKYRSPDDLLITPFYEVTPSGPSPLVIGGVAGAIIVAGALIYWRSRRIPEVRGAKKRSGKKPEPSKPGSTGVIGRGGGRGGRRTQTSRHRQPRT